MRNRLFLSLGRWRLPSLLIGLICLYGRAAERPNILWITVEDMSANLGCYGDTYAETPRLDAFAKESVRYTHAFATAPVCSPARSTLITGCYATSLGTQRLRSTFPLPQEIHGFPTYLRRVGYFTSNNVKTDYNVADEKVLIDESWTRNGPEAHWRQRESGQPFFSIFNLMTTHQSRANVWTWEQFEEEVGSKLSPGERHDPAKAPLPPYYPDTALVRRTMARYYDCIQVMDAQVGRWLDQLEEDGLADDTIVFFYSDHGMGMPRGKRVLHDSGMRVPLMIRFPESWRRFAPAPPGESLDRLVSFVDFPPTVLSLLGLEIPDYMQGRPFLGAQRVAPREFVIGARDRVDEVFDLSRSIRGHRYLFIENYMPWQSWMPPERYSDNADMRRQMKSRAASGQLNESQLTYAAPRRAPVEIYDTANDPHQIHNLADEPQYQSVLQTMRSLLYRWQRETADLGFFMEPDLRRRLGDQAPWDYGQEEFREFQDTLFAAARTAAQSRDSAQMIVLLQHSDPAIRYWGAAGLKSVVGSIAQEDETLEVLTKTLRDPSAPVRIEAASVLLQTANVDQALALLKAELRNEEVENRLHAMRSLELAGDRARPVREAIEAARQEAEMRESELPVWMFVRFSAEAALEELGP